MKHTVSVESALRFTKLSVYLAYTWPPSKDASNWEIAKNDIAVSLSNLSILCLLIAILAQPIARKGDSISLTDSIINTTSCCNYIIKTHVYRAHRKRIQVNKNKLFFFYSPEHEL